MWIKWKLKFPPILQLTITQGILGYESNYCLTSWLVTALTDITEREPSCTVLSLIALVQTVMLHGMDCLQFCAFTSIEILY